MSDTIMDGGEVPNDQRFIMYIFRGHCQDVLNDDQKELAVIGFIRNKLQLIFDRIPDGVRNLCLQFYSHEKGNPIKSEFEKVGDFQTFMMAERANEIYRQQLKYMQDHLASLRSLIQDKENIIENMMLRYETKIIKMDPNRQNCNLGADEIEQTELRRKAEALAQRTILENYELRELTNEVREENFLLKDDIHKLQDKIDRLEKSKTEKRDSEVDVDEENSADNNHIAESPSDLSALPTEVVQKILVYDPSTYHRAVCREWNVHFGQNEKNGERNYRDEEYEKRPIEIEVLYHYETLRVKDLERELEQRIDEIAALQDQIRNVTTERDELRKQLSSQLGVTNEDPQDVGSDMRIVD